MTVLVIRPVGVSAISGSTLDQWMTAGRQLVDGVAGATAGSRSQARRGANARSGADPLKRPVDLPQFKGVGRWMENQLDAFNGGEDDWSERSPESWQRPIPEETRSPNQGRDHGRPHSVHRSNREPIKRRSPQLLRPLAAPKQRRLLDAIFNRRAAPLLPPASLRPKATAASSRRSPLKIRRAGACP